MAEGTDQVLVGKQIGAYKITSLLGAGGMGEVYRAEDTRLGRTVAVKVLPRELAQDEERLHRFVREARAASALNHANVAHIYEIGQSDGLHFIAMEYVEGQSLAQKMSGQPLDLDEVLTIGVQAADALDEAHRKGIIHRDIKSANLMMTPKGQAKVLDFGLAKITHAAGEAVGSDVSTSIHTTEGKVMGTLGYMSPEQVLGKELDGRTDLFSLGVVLYEMTTGRLPFSGNRANEVTDRILHAQPEAIARFNYDVPAELERIIRKCLEKDRERRYQLAREVRADLSGLKKEGAASEWGPRVKSPDHSQDASPFSLRRRLWLIAGLLVAVFGLFFFLWTRPLPAPRVLRTTQITDDGKPKSNVLYAGGFFGTALVTDGSRVFFNNKISPQAGQLYQVATGGGETVAIPLAISSPAGLRLLDISPDGGTLLIALHQGIGPSGLWIVSTLGGSARKVGDALVGDALASAAAWSPDGAKIAYGKENELFVANGDGSQPRKLVSLPKQIQHLRWSPDRRHIRLTLGGLDASKSIWEVVADGSNVQPLLPGWNNPPAECCGHWTSDGRYFVFLSTRDGVTNIWAIRERQDLFRNSGRQPVQLTTGPIHFHSLVPSRDGRQLFVLGVKMRGELVRYDASSHQLVSYLGGMSASLLDFTSDGQWVTYRTYPEGSLWRSRLDGSDRLQLTFPPMRVNLPRWSPDGKLVAFCGWAAPGRPSKIYVVSAAGGAPEEQIPEDVSPQYDPCWSPDGNSLAWGRVPKRVDPSIEVPLAIYILNLKNRQISTVPGSQGRFHPEWSPDGRYIAAYHEDGHMVLFDFATQKWTDVTDFPVEYHKWSRDGKSVLFNSGPRLYRARIIDLKLEQVAALADLRPGGWYGYAPDDSPLTIRDAGTQEIYALDVEFP